MNTTVKIFLHKEYSPTMPIFHPDDTISQKKNLISSQYRECGCIERLAGKIITAPIYNIHEYQLQKHAESISMA
jgi:hypothetical protein